VGKLEVWLDLLCFGLFDLCKWGVLVGLQESCNFGEWAELEVVSLRLELVKVEDLGFFLAEIVQELSQKLQIRK
jgi:hypothetical protein